MRLTFWNERKAHYDWHCENNEIADKLAAYEDTGLTPEDILCIRATQRITPERLAEIVRAEFDGRLVILPCKVGDTVWFYLYENRGGIRKGIYQGIITELKAVQRLNRDTPLFLAFVRFEYPDPWYSFKQLSTSEMHCSFCEYGSWVQFYLTREEAEAALKGEGQCMKP